MILLFVEKGPVKWLALQDKYFISVFMPEEATGLVAKLGK